MNSTKIHIVTSGTLSAEQREAIELAARTLGAFVIDTQTLPKTQAADQPALRHGQAAATRGVKNAVVMYDLATSAPQILSPDERDTLVSGIAEERHSWEQDWVGDVVGNGYIGWHSHPDHLVIEDAFVTNFCLGSLGKASDKLKLLRVMARPEVFAIVRECLVKLGEDDDALDNMIETLESSREPCGDLKPGSVERVELTDLIDTLVQQLEQIEEDSLIEAAAPATTS